MPVVTSSIFQVSSLALLSREHLLRNILVIPSYPLPYPSSTKPTLEKLGLLSNYIVFKLDLNIKKILEHTELQNLQKFLYFNFLTQN